MLGCTRSINHVNDEVGGSVSVSLDVRDNSEYIIVGWEQISKVSIAGNSFVLFHHLHLILLHGRLVYNRQASTASKKETGSEYYLC